MIKKMKALALCAFAVASGGALPSAFGATIPFTSALVQFVNVPTGGGVQMQTNSAPASATTETNSQSGTWGSAAGFAMADLSTGQLKASAATSDPGNGNGTQPYANVNALFGDSFTTTTATAQPFSWTSSTTAQFSMTLDGTLTPGDLSTVNASAFIVLLLYDKGTLDPSENLLSSPNLMGTPYLWTIGNAGVQLFYTPPGGTSTPLTATANFDTIPSSIVQTITPGGDFDWVLLLGTGGQPASGQSFSVDLAHTVTLAYQGPVGTTTASASGMFENITTAVPEPGSLVLLSLGISAIVARRRRVR